MSDYDDRLDDMVAERGDVAYLHDLPETGDHHALVEMCDRHGRYVARSWAQPECPTCADEPFVSVRHFPGRER